MRETKRLHNLLADNIGPRGRHWVENKIISPRGDTKRREENNGSGIFWKKIWGTLAINSAAPLASGELFALVNGFRKKPILRPRSNSWNDPKHMARCSAARKRAVSRRAPMEKVIRIPVENRWISSGYRVTRARKGGGFLFHKRSDRE